METSLFRPEAAVSVDALHSHLVAAGFVRRSDRTAARQHSVEWVRENNAVVFYRVSALSGGTVVALRSADNDALVDSLRAVVPLESLAEFLARFERDAEVVSLLASIGQLQELARLLDAPHAGVIELVTSLLGDERRAVAIALIELIEPLLWDELDAPFATLLAREPTFAGYAAYREQSKADLRDGTLNDGQTTDVDELVDRCKLGLRDNQIARVKRAAQMILDDNASSHHGLGYRGMAAQREGRLVASFVDLTLAVALTADKPNWQPYWEEQLAATKTQLAAAGAIALTTDDRALLAATTKAQLRHHDAALATIFASLPAYSTTPDDPVIEFFAAEVARHRAQFATAIATMRRVREALPHSLYAAMAYHDLVARYPNENYAPHYDENGYPEKPADQRERNEDERAETTRALDAAEARLAFAETADDSDALIASFYRSEHSTWNARKLYRHRADETYAAGDYERTIAYADRIIAAETIDSDHQRATWLRAQALTMLRRHVEAIDAYALAIKTVNTLKRSGDSIFFSDPRGQLYFNRSCELAKTGRRDEALRDLRQAISFDHKWIGSAQKDDYFEALWPDAAFVALLANPPTVRDSNEPEIDDAEAAQKTLLGHVFRGEYDDAKKIGAALLRYAEDHDDGARIVAVQKYLGSAFTYSGDTDEGLRRAQASVTLAATVFADRPAERVEPIHMLGAVHHARREYDEARARYDEALALRTATEGADSIAHAKSFGDLARLAVDRGVLDEAVQWTERARTLLGAALLRLDATADDWFEAMFDLASIESNVAMMLAPTERHADAIAALERSVDAFSRFAAADRTVPVAYIERTVRRLQPLLAHETLDEALRERGLAALEQLATLHPDHDAPPAVRAEKIFWRALAFGLWNEVANGKTEQEVGGILHRMITDGKDVPASLLPLRAQLAERVARGSFLVTSMMSIDLLEKGAQSLAETIASLTDIGVGHAWEGTGSA